MTALFAPASVHAQGKARVANEGEIRDEWRIADGVKLGAPGYPGAFADRGESVCVAMGYRINPDGTTGNYTLLKAWSGTSGDREPAEGFWDAFAQASAAALGEWKFAPRQPGASPRAVDTVATMTFSGARAVEPSELRARCRIDDLTAYLEQVKLDLGKRGDMNRYQIEKNMRETMGNLAKGIQLTRAGKEER